MKLNSRTGLLILPVITLGYLAAFLGVYLAFKHLLFELEAAAGAKQVAELSSSLTRYSMMLDQYYLLIYQDQRVRQLLASSQADLRRQRELDQAISRIDMIPRNQLTVAALDSRGELAYLYSNSREFTSPQNTGIADWVGRTVTEGRTDAIAVWHRDPARMVRMRLIDRQTLQTPDPGGVGDALALVVGIDTTDFQQQVDALVASGKRIEWVPRGSQLKAVDSDQRRAFENADIVVQESVLSLGVLRIITPAAVLEHQLSVVRWLLGFVFVVLVALSYLSQRWLIWRYITLPIKRLERELTGLGREHEPDEQQIAAGPDDEIGSLNRSFARMQQDLRKSYQIAREMAEKDGLTRLYNRRMFYYHVDRLLQRAALAQGRVALFCIDVDNLKAINDRFGHCVGDELLRNFADCLREVLRPGDLVATPLTQNYSARLAGDEFAVVLYDYDDDDIPRRVLTRVFGICDQGYLTPRAPVPSSLSIGVACYPTDADSAAALIANADAAMSQAKSKGKNQYSFYSRALADKARRVADIEAALAPPPYAEFRLYYMPIVDAATSQVTGVEALLRWQSPKLGWVSPDEFIPVAESMGAFRGIDRWVINQASVDLQHLQSCFGESVYVSVNISAAELVSREFVDEITAMVQQGFINPANIELEITETFHLNHSAGGDAILQQFRELGFSISIDDFGTGYTALLQLVEYPVDRIKLDKTFLHRVLQCDRVEVVVSLVEFCKSQHFAITAEGVETREQRTAMTAAGCDSLQGFYFSPPLRLDQLLLKYSPAEAADEVAADAPAQLRLVMV